MVWPLFLYGQCHGLAASAQGDALDVQWADDGVCPSPPGLAADVAVLLGGELPTYPLPRFAVSTRARESGGVQVELHVYADQGESYRELGTADCDEAYSAAAMLIALAMAPDAGVATKPSPPPEPAPKPEPEPVPTLLSESEPEPAFEGSASTAAEGWGIGIAGGVDIFQLPNASLFVGIGSSWRSQALRLELLATWTGPAEVIVVEQRDAAIEMFAIGGSARSCVLGAAADLRLGPCANVRGGYVVGRAVGIEGGQDAGAPWFSLGLDARLEWRISDALAIQITWGVEGGLIRPVFGIRGSETAHTLPRFNTLGGLGIALFL